MNLVDIIIIVLLAGAAAHGLWVGAAVQGLSAVGTLLGLVAGAAVAPLLSRVASDPLARAVLALIAVFGLAALFGAVGRQLGVRVWGRLRRAGLGAVDSALGALFAAITTLLAAWIVAGMLATVPARPVANAIQRSTVLRTLGHALPAAPSVFSRLQRLVDVAGFPQVFAEFEPGPAQRLPLPGDPVVRAAVGRAGGSTLKIRGGACGFIQEGSGFLAGPGLVVTNAHVVAGVTNPSVIDRKGVSHRATPVLFDPKLDLAVLRTGGITAPVLQLAGSPVPRATEAAVLGYPGGGPFDAQPGVVLARYDAIGRDIYGRSLSTRTVYEIQSRVRPGNSGGPLARPDGTVIGVVFARSSRNDDIGYALASDTVGGKVAAAERQTSRVDTGPCTAG
jgi:S1-C subfamily serine protease